MAHLPANWPTHCSSACTTNMSIAPAVNPRHRKPWKRSSRSGWRPWEATLSSIPHPLRSAIAAAALLAGLGGTAAAQADQIFTDSHLIQGYER